MVYHELVLLTSVPPSNSWTELYLSLHFQVHQYQHSGQKSDGVCSLEAEAYIFLEFVAILHSTACTGVLC